MSGGASYPPPITHGNTLNTVFNSSDFNFSSLSNTNVSGNLNVSGIGTFNSGIQVNGNHAITGNLNCTGNSTVSSSSVVGNETIGGTETITGLLTCNSGIQNNGNLNCTGTSTVQGLLTCNSGIQINGTHTITGNLSCTGSSTVGSSIVQGNETVSGTETITGLLYANGGIQLSTPSSIIPASVPTISCSNKSYATFTLTMANNITGFGFSSIRAGGQYVIFITGGSSIYTISNALTGGNPASFKTNFGGSALNIPINGSVILNCFYDGTTMYVGYVSYA